MAAQRSLFSDRTGPARPGFALSANAERRSTRNEAARRGAGQADRKRFGGSSNTSGDTGKSDGPEATPPGTASLEQNANAPSPYRPAAGTSQRPGDFYGTCPRLYPARFSAGSGANDQFGTTLRHRRSIRRRLSAQPAPGIPADFSSPGRGGQGAAQGSGHCRRPGCSG